MNLKKWPYWLKGGSILSVIGTIIFLLLPEDVSNLAFTPWWAGWFIVPAFIIFSAICIIFGIDFISNTDNKAHSALLSTLWIISVFAILFVVGSLIGLTIGIIKSKKKIINSSKKV